MHISSIQIKIVSLVLLVLTISIFLSISFTLSNQKENLLESSRQTLTVNTRVLNSTIRNIMLSGEAPLANKTMADLRNLPEFLEYDIYRRDGSVAFNDFSTLNFVNSYQNRIMFEETPRQEGERIASEGFAYVLKHRVPRIRLDESAREMEYYFPILNYADCRACHGDDHFIRGIAHFRISLEDIYEKISSAQRLLILFFTGVGLFLFIGILFLIRRVILRPIFSIGQAVSRVGEGDLEVVVDLDQKDELGQLGNRINQMILGLKVSKKLELDNARIEARLSESRKYLDHINEGLLLLTEDYRITEEYSLYLEKLFETDSIAGRDFMDFVCENSSNPSELREELETFLDMLFHNRTAAMSMIMDVNPLDQLSLKLPSGNEIIIRAGFQRIMEGELVLNLMVLFEDMTEILRTREALETEKIMRESELEQIAAILKLGPRVFEDFLISARDVLDYLKSHMNDFNRKEVLEHAFRETHSLKGTARYLKFIQLEQQAHELEDRFSLLNKNNEDISPAFLEDLEKDLAELETQLNSIEQIIQRFRSFSIGKESQDPEMDLFRDRLSEMVAEVTEELGKKASLEIHSDWPHIPGVRQIQNSVMHLIRNSLDHGLEEPMERLAAGKEETGRLKLSFFNDGETLRLEMQDDGGGMDFEALEKRGLETGLLKPGNHFPSQILKTLFMSGFSTKEEVSKLSGRGVGLDAVKTDVQKLNGKITVRTQKSKGTTFVLTIPLSSLEEINEM